MRYMLQFGLALGCCFALVVTPSMASEASRSLDKREWVDATGNLVIEGSLMGFDEETVILQTSDEELISINIKDLSEADQEYLQSREANALMSKSIEQEQVWTLETGTKVLGRVVEFVEAEVTVRRRLGKIYVNDKRFSNLPDVYQRIIPRLVGHFENEQIETEQELLDFMVTLRSRPKTYECEGVKIEFGSGDLYALPFFVFQTEDRNFLKDGFQRWKGAKEDEEKQQQEAMYLEAEARAYQQQEQRERDQQARVTQMQLQLLAVAADVTDMWEVELIPRPNFYAPVTSMVVVAGNSAQAMQIAAANNPQYVVGGVRKLNRSGNRYRWR